MDVSCREAAGGSGDAGYAKEVTDGAVVADRVAEDQQLNLDWQLRRHKVHKMGNL